MRTLVAIISTTSEIPTYPSGLGILDPQLQNSPRVDLRRLQTRCRKRCRNGRRNGSEQLGGAAAFESSKLDVDQVKDDLGLRHLRIPLDDHPAAAKRGGQDSRRCAPVRKSLQEMRQGFGHRRENCQCNDRSVVQRASGRRRDALAVVPFGKFEQRVRPVHSRVPAPKGGTALSYDGVVDGVSLRIAGFALDAQSEINHGRFIVSRRKRAILRVTPAPRALVVSTGKNSAQVSVDGENAVRTAQLRRMTGERFMPVPGDVVTVRLLADGQAVVDRIEPRTFTLQRRSAGGRAKTMAANIDLLVLVAALAHPAPRLVTLDQLLAFAEIEQIAAALVLTKPDLAERARADDLCALYRGLGYPTIVVNPKEGENIDSFRELIRGHRALLVGNSGVGKSTIFRALGGETSVGEVSRYGLGRQTTTAGRLYRLGEGFLIDSPGINEFGLGTIEPAALAEAFREMRDPRRHCRFGDCTHLAEPDCAVQSAVATSGISPSRYASYRRMLTEPT